MKLVHTLLWSELLVSKPLNESLVGRCVLFVEGRLYGANFVTILHNLTHLTHCVSSAKVVGSIPREHILTKK